jgi:hypothetical protein
MAEHNISIDNFSDAYLLGYGAGSMGDFLASLMIYSFYKKFNQPHRREIADSFYYEPWSKKWLVNDSTTGKFRTYLEERKNIIHSSDPTNTTNLRKFHITEEMINSSDELAHFFVRNSGPNKLKKIPYFFVSENITFYSRTEVSGQRLKNINFIYSRFKDTALYPLYFLLPLYKNTISAKRYSASIFQTRDEFISDTEKILTAAKNNRPIVRGQSEVQDKILEKKNHYDFDIMKLLLEYDPQGLEFLITDDAESKNMIDLARRDMFDILDFFNLDLGDLTVSDTDHLHKIYDRIERL